ncbi:glycosyltransferase [Bacteroides sp. 224]|uniref:glycosyltransferase n=1 Tax=Bacteroides sp. 224 TaxID=2302936 RepID=UPI0013D088BE|nr:glycosyltransferase [Bacteroides sp. 224]NDV66984.1 glycosyltransferase family 4 protein [Bacteroides sp. 224]
MKLLFYLTRFPGVGGIETVTSIISQALINKGYQIDIISHCQQNDNYNSNNIRLWRMPNTKRWASKKNYIYIDQILKNNDYNAIIYQDSYAPTESIICSISKKHKIPLYVFEHNSPLFIYNKRNLDSILTVKGFLRRFFHPYLLYQERKRKRMLLDTSKQYILLSKQFISEFCKLVDYRNTEDKVIFIHNPIAIKTPANIEEKENIVLYVGRLTPEKRVDAMLKVWKKIQNSTAIDWKFIIVGDGTERPKLEKMVQSLKLRNVKFEGFQDPSKYYQRAKIFLMMSKFEGWGLTLIESMQYGVVPIAQKNFSSIIDIIDNGLNGYIVDDRLESIQYRISDLISNKNLLMTMSENAIMKSKLFNIESIIPQWIDLLKKQ